MADDDVRELLTALSAEGVRSIIVGAYALASHGYVRATSEIDVLVEPTLRNARRLTRAIRKFAGTSVEYFGVTEAELSRPKVGFFMGVEPNRIDILTKIAGVRFSRAWEGRTRSEIEGVTVCVLGLTEMIAAKRASVGKRTPGSHKALQDAADLRWLLDERARRRDR